MTRMQALENDIAELQERLAVRSEVINREVESVGPMVGLVDSVRTSAAAKQGRMSRATREHPVASAISALSTFYVAAQQSGLIDRFAGSARRAKTRAELKYAEHRASAAQSTSDSSATAKARIAETKTAASQKYDELAETISDSAESAAQQGRAAYAKSRGFVEQNPVAVGLLAAGVGAAAASFLMMGRKDDDGAEPLARSKAPVVRRRPAAPVAPAKRPTTAKAAPKAPAAAKAANKAPAAKSTANVKSAKAKTAKKTEATRHLQKPATKGTIPAAELNGGADNAPANTASTTARPVDEIFRS